MVEKMELWMSEEIQADVADAFMEIRKAIKAEVNRLLAGVPVVEKAKEWAFIAILREEDSPDYPEVVKKSSRGSVLEFRLKIPHSQFLSGDYHTRVRLIFQALSRSVVLMERLGVSSETRDSLQSVLLQAEKRLSG